MKTMEKTLQNISHISFFFMLVLGLLHISSSFLIVQEVTSRSAWILFNGLDLPFLAAVLVYGSSRLSLNLGRITGNLALPLTLCVVLSTVLFFMALFINFALPDVTSF